jgi:hypothetical protein
MPPVVDNFIGAVGLVHVNDIDLLALLEQDAALPSDLVGRAAIVEARERAFVRLRQAWTEPAIRGHRPHIGRRSRADSRATMMVPVLSMCCTPKAYLQADSGAGLSAKAWFSALPGLKYRKAPPS